ncbi:MAG TPA: hypothetical protein VE226_03570 [Nitrososphaeraceae archaeon]|nr:hypothetical protein [Nitrososphaeraceae archaeon]
MAANSDTVVIYSSTPRSPLNNPSGANRDGAFVVGRSPQQLSANFLMSYSTNSISFCLRRSIALRESERSSTISTGLRRFILCFPPRFD